MIQVPPSANVVVMHESISFRNGIDGTVAIARTVLDKEPMDGAIFVFRNRQRHMLRVLFYDGSGFWLCTKRLSKGRFSKWPTGDGKSRCSALLARELQILIWGGDPQSCAFPDLWRKVA
jgi:transposase